MTSLEVVLSCDSGKDSAWALHVLHKQDGLEVVRILITLGDDRFG